MKAIAVTPGQKNSSKIIDVPKPKVTDVPNGRGVLVKVLKVALDGTDRDIDKGEYGGVPFKRNTGFNPNLSAIRIAFCMS